ncbi:UNVERIFIED_CONTAM: anti-sigma factor-like protein [Acetivibrio alkalicellulosi]
MKRKGIILKIQGDYAIGITDECEIVQILRQPGMCEGLKIYFDPPIKNYKVKKLVEQISIGIKH